MATNRRQFLPKVAAIGGASALFPLASCSRSGKADSDLPDYSALDAALARPVLRTEYFPDPVQLPRSGMRSTAV